jgi:hypothetical protein
VKPKFNIESICIKIPMENKISGKVLAYHAWGPRFDSQHWERERKRERERDGLPQKYTHTTMCMCIQKHTYTYTHTYIPIFGHMVQFKYLCCLIGVLLLEDHSELCSSTAYLLCLCLHWDFNISPIWNFGKI